MNVFSPSKVRWWSQHPVGYKCLLKFCTFSSHCSLLFLKPLWRVNVRNWIRRPAAGWQSPAQARVQGLRVAGVGTPKSWVILSQPWEYIRDVPFPNRFFCLNVFLCNLFSALKRFYQFFPHFFLASLLFSESPTGNPRRDLAVGACVSPPPGQPTTIRLTLLEPNTPIKHFPVGHFCIVTFEEKQFVPPCPRIFLEVFCTLTFVIKPSLCSFAKQWIYFFPLYFAFCHFPKNSVAQKFF